MLLVLILSRIILLLFLHKHTPKVELLGNRAKKNIKPNNGDYQLLKINI